MVSGVGRRTEHGGVKNHSSEEEVTLRAECFMRKEELFDNLKPISIEHLGISGGNNALLCTQRAPVVAL